MAGRIAEYIDRMTPERILKLAERPDGFSVHRYRWRDDKVRARAMKLSREGKLGRPEIYKDVLIFKARQSTGGERP